MEINAHRQLFMDFLCDYASLKGISDNTLDKVIEYIASDHVIDISDETFNKYVKLLFPYFKKV